MPVRILAISGSLRAASSNTAVVEAVAALAPADVEIDVYAGLADLPPFNPDDDREPLNPSVADLRVRVLSADALFISSPEYAHGVPGVLKNALDWLVGGEGEIVGKPIALVNAAPRATHAQASLAETLRTMSTHVIPAASITIDLAGRKPTPADILADPALAGALRRALAALADSAVSSPDVKAGRPTCQEG